MTATQGEKPSAARGEGKSKPPTVKDDFAERRPASEVDQPEGKQEVPRRRGIGAWIASHKLATTAVIILALAAVAGGVAWWLNARQYENTDDAFIDAHPSAIGPQVAAAITDVPVTDNEIVKPGQVLARLDDRDYVAAVAQAKAQIAQAEATISSAEAQTTAQQATINQMAQQVTQAQAALAYSQDQNQRAQTLLKEGSGTLQNAQQANSDLVQKQAALDAAQAALNQAKRQLAVFAAQRQVGEGQPAGRGAARPGGR